MESGPNGLVYAWNTNKSTFQQRRSKKKKLRIENLNISIQQKGMIYLFLGGTTSSNKKTDNPTEAEDTDTDPGRG